MEHFDRLVLEEDDEELEVEIGEATEVNDETNPAWRFAGRFLTNRPIRTDVMKTAMAGVWCPVKGTNTGIYVFQFHHHLDVQRVLKGGPWFFNKHMLILGSMAATTQPEEVSLYSFPFWVQVHNVPVGAWSEKNGKQIAESMGEFLEYDEKNNSNYWRKYMWIRVMLDVRRPLKKTKRLKSPGGGTHEVHFKYERLGMFCYYCGLLGHTDETCDLLYSTEVDDGNRNWGPEVRVEARKARDGGGGRWLREEGQIWKTPDQGERQTSSSINNTLNVTLNAEERGKEVSKTMLAELMKNPSILIPRHNIQKLKKQVNGEGAATSLGEMEECSKGLNDAQMMNFEISTKLANWRKSNAPSSDVSR